MKTLQYTKAKWGKERDELSEKVNSHDRKENFFKVQKNKDEVKHFLFSFPLIPHDTNTVIFE
jgi:hypothetical protein